MAANSIKIAFLGLFLTLNQWASAQRPKDAAAIMAVLNQQTAAWNSGQIDRFMVGYWNSDSLVFIGSRGPKYGYQTTLENYKKGYPDAASMGQLHFDILKMRPLGRKHCLVIGKWHLARPQKGDLEGHFSLILKKIKGQWVVIADHSS